MKNINGNKPKHLLPVCRVAPTLWPLLWWPNAYNPFHIWTISLGKEVSCIPLWIFLLKSGEDFSLCISMTFSISHLCNLPTLVWEQCVVWNLRCAFHLQGHMAASYEDILRAISFQHSATKHALKRREIWQWIVTFWSLSNAMLGFVYKERHFVAFLRSVVCLWLVLLH